MSDTITGEAFVNEDSLFLDLPVSMTVIADEDSTLIALPRDKLKEMEAHNPRCVLYRSHHAAPSFQPAPHPHLPPPSLICISQVQDRFNEILMEQVFGVEYKCERLRYVIIDWSNVDGIDHTGVGVFLTLVEQLKGNGIFVAFTGCSEKITRKLDGEAVLESSDRV